MTLKKKIILIVSLVLVLCCGYLVYAYVHGRQMLEVYFNHVRQTTYANSNSVADLSVVDIKNSTNETLSLQGRVAIMAFATWCAPCIEELQLYQDSVTSEDRVYFVSWESTETLQRFYKMHKFKIPIYQDTSFNLGKSSLTLPTSFIFNDNVLLYRMDGQLPYSMMKMILNKKDIAP